MARRISQVLLCLAGTFGAHGILAQTPATLRIGDRVRITSTKSWTGVVQSSTTDSISLLPAGVTAPLSFALGSISKLEVPAGRKSRGTGFLIGAGIGGAGALLLGALSDDDCDVDRNEDPFGFGEGLCDTFGTVAMVSLSAVGALVGGGIGALLGGGERWRTIGVPGQLGVGVAPGGRLGLALRVGMHF